MNAQNITLVWFDIRNCQLIWIGIQWT